MSRAMLMIFDFTQQNPQHQISEGKHHAIETI